MNKFTKYIAVGVMCCALLCTVVSVKASSGSLSYSTSKNSYTYIGELVNNSAKAKTLSVNTRPTAGTGGVNVKIATHDGTLKASKVFPYYTSTSDLTANFPAGAVRRIYVKPNTSGEHIQGAVNYSY